MAVSAAHVEEAAAAPAGWWLSKLSSLLSSSSGLSAYSQTALPSWMRRSNVQVGMDSGLGKTEGRLAALGCKIMDKWGRGSA